MASRPLGTNLTLVDFILNLVALLLWINWRSLRLHSTLRPVSVSLASTVKPTQPDRLRGWHFLAGVALLLAIRAFVYWGIGGPVGWTARLDLGIVVLPFRSDLIEPIALFSLVGFLRVALVFYFWLIVLGAINGPAAENDPVSRVLKIQLGRLGTWPWWAQLLFALLATIVGWMALQPLLSHAQVTDGHVSIEKLALQGLLIAAGLILSLKFILPVFLLAHLVSSYVYLGNSPVWDFVSVTARSMLRPISWLPLRVGKLDLGPLVGATLIFALLHWLPVALATELTRRKLSIWPE